MLFQENTLLPVSVQKMDKGFMHSCNNDPSTQRQHRNLQIKAHRSDLTSAGDAFQHFLSVSCPRTTPPCSLQGNLSSRLLQCPGAQLHVLLPSRVRPPQPSPTLGPGVWEEIGLSVSVAEQAHTEEHSQLQAQPPACTLRAQRGMLVECP